MLLFVGAAGKPDISVPIRAKKHSKSGNGIIAWTTSSNLEPLKDWFSHYVERIFELEFQTGKAVSILTKHAFTFTTPMPLSKV